MGKHDGVDTAGGVGKGREQSTVGGLDCDTGEQEDGGGDGQASEDTYQVIYLAGPMTGIENFNYDAFNQVAARLRRHPHIQIINPAENFDGDQTLARENYLHRALLQVLRADAVYVLPGWELSPGARLEVSVARAIGLPIYTTGRLDWELVRFPEGSPQPMDFHDEPVKPKTLTEEASSLVTGDRQSDYGHPWHDFSRTARLWGAILDVDVTPEQVALCMVGLKLSREVNKPKRDNKVDAIGYLLTLEMVQRYRAETQHQDDLDGWA